MSQRTGTFLGTAIGVAVVTMIMLFVLTPKNIAPQRPKEPVAANPIPETTCNLSLPVKLPKAAVVAQLEKAIPRSFPFDSQGDARVYGNPSRGAISVEVKPAEKRVELSMPLGGRIQVEKKVLFLNVSVGIDAQGKINASVAPVAAKDWSIDPHLGLSVHVENAVAKTAIGDIGVTGPAQDGVNKALEPIRNSASQKLAEQLKFRGDVEPVWKKLHAVHQIAREPATWIQITPQSAAFQQFGYHPDGLDAGLALTLHAHVLVQPESPPVSKVAGLPDLSIVDRVPEGFELAIPVEISFDAINNELKKQLSKETFHLPEVDAWVKITSAELQPFGEKLLLVVDFQGKQGWFHSAKGRLYIEGLPEFDSNRLELRVKQLEYALDTAKAIETLDWLVHARLLELLSGAAVVPLSNELPKVKDKAQSQIKELKKKLPPEIGADIDVNKLTLDGIHVRQKSVFGIIQAKGKMSAQLQK